MLNSIDKSNNHSDSNSSSSKKYVFTKEDTELKKFDMYYDLVDTINKNNGFALPEDKIYQIIDSQIDKMVVKGAEVCDIKLGSESEINELKYNILTANGYPVRCCIVNDIKNDLLKAEKECHVLDIPDFSSLPLRADNSTSICSTIGGYVKASSLAIGCVSTAIGLAWYADVSPLVTIGSVVIGAGLHYVATKTEHNADNVFVAL